MFTIIREHKFDTQIEYLTNDFTRMTDLDNAIDWALGKNADQIPNTYKLGDGFYLWVTDEFYNLDIPEVRILYKIDISLGLVTLISIEEVSKISELISMN